MQNRNSNGTTTSRKSNTAVTFIFEIFFYADIVPLALEHKIYACHDRLKRYRDIFSSASIFKKVKLKFIIAVFLAPLFNNVENWNLSNSLIAKLNSLSRSIKKVVDSIQTNSFRVKLEEFSALELIKQRKT
eukprot:snap_masked-scaffold_3-processed-gene-17.27-mRNA-1 protein AED:1.00 eAED:1.00 QI:0/0/0/0/1/1/2/0/130